MSAPADDWMAIADAVGVNATPTPLPQPETATTWAPHPSHHHEFTDPALAAILANWSRAAAGEDLTDEPITDYLLCGTCGGTGLIETRTYPSGTTWAVTCPSCGGDS